MTVDWNIVHAQLDAAKRTIDEMLEPTPDVADRILRERARVLAGARHEETPAPYLELVCFARGEERYGFPLRHAIEVLRIHEIVPIPGVPHSFAGVINFRGEVLAVIDLQGERPDPTRRITDTTRVVVIGGDEAELGIFADAVEGMRSLEERELMPSTAGDLLGVTRDGLCVLDSEAILADERFIVDQSEERGGR